MDGPFSFSPTSNKSGPLTYFSSSFLERRRKRAASFEATR
jgi:hypothetical protein